MQSSLKISKSLKNTCNFLNDKEHHQLAKDVELVCQQLVNPHFGIAVVAPFNFGKSTLINALLGRETMPTKMIRTTGTVISVKYGKSLTTIVTLKSGKVIRSHDTEILKEFAVLNRKGERREDVISVEVLYPHELLKNGVELFDLPGTNDREEQDTLVRDKLLQVDLVIQILNARQPFTKGEKDTLHEWLFNRGIKTIIFVLNRMNELENKNDKNEVYNDVYSIAKSFQSNLPQGSKKLYRVDALPAIKAQQKQNIWKILTSGIITFESALFAIISIQREKNNQTRLLRVITIASQVKSVLENKANNLIKELTDDEYIRNIAIEKGKQRESYLRGEFNRRVEAYRNWLSLNNLLGSYQDKAAQALETGHFKFNNWQDSQFQPTIISYTQSIEEWANYSCDEFYIDRPSRINLSLPSYPYISLPQRQDRNVSQRIGDIFNGGANRKRLDSEYERKKWQAYKSAAYKYLYEFSKSTLAYLNQYEKNVESLIVFPIPPESPTVIQKRYYLNDLNSSLNAIKSIESLRIKTNTYTFNWLEIFKFFILFCKNFFYLLFK